MGCQARKWQWIVAVMAACLVSGAAAAATQFTSFSDRSATILEGNWQSCREADGRYSERIYDSKRPGLGPFEFHMGPYHEFALFRGVQDEHREHQSSDNLLKPYNVTVVGTEAKQRWETAGLRIDVVLAGGSREDCESWFVSLRPLDTSTSR